MPMWVSSVFPKSNSMILYTINEFAPSPHRWFSLDYQSMTLKNLCFETPWNSAPNISPDGNFIAFSRSYPDYPAGEITILNLSTGDVSTIEGYQLIGWGVQE